MSKAGDGDKRTVATDALMTLGMIIGPEEKRDAIHLAVEPVIAGEALSPGEHVTVSNGIATGTEDGQGLGIVDPFLPGVVTKGDRFWFVMYPRQVHSLRHVWTHPAFPDVSSPVEDASEKASAEKWLRWYADKLDVGFRDLVESAAVFLKYGDYMVRGGTLEGVSTSEEFWEQYAAYTGDEVPEDKRENFFSCSC